MSYCCVAGWGYIGKMHFGQVVGKVDKGCITLGCSLTVCCAYICMYTHPHHVTVHGTSVCVCVSPQEKTYSRANEVAKLEKLMKFVREPLLDKDK